MDYTTQALAKKTGVSLRTLRYYDQIGLLKPQIRMINGRCIYGIKELLTLLQILTLKDFGFSLEKIGEILKENGRRKLCALKAQKTVLLKQQIRLNKNIELIELMIEQCKQEKTMDSYDAKVTNHLDDLNSKHEYAQAFDESYMKEIAMAAFEIFRVKVGEEYYDAFLKNQNKLDTKDAQIYGTRMGLFLSKIQEAMGKELPVDSEEVQQLIANQWETLKIVYPNTASKQIYLEIRDQIYQNPILLNDKASSQISHYTARAMEIFAKGNFPED